MQWIEDRAALDAFCAAARGQGPLALDMEFERERTYRATLQLIQLASPTEQALVDPLAIDDLSPLWDLVADAEQPILFHAGGQDMEIFYDQSGGRTPTNVFDTQVAAALLGMGEQPGYADLARRLLDVKLKKGERTTNWAQRPLTDAQIQYALDDVLYLHRMHEQLMKRLHDRGRFDWLAEELHFYEEEGTYKKDPRKLWMRVSRHRSLDRKGLAILRELAHWREEAAAHRNIPRNRVTADDVLIDLARRKPREQADLSALRRLHPKEAERSGKRILEAVTRGLECPQEDWPKLPTLREEDAKLNLTTDLMAVFLKLRAREAKIAPSYLGTKKDIVDLAYRVVDPGSDEEHCRLLQGWRRGLAGDDLVRLLKGELTVLVDGESHYLRVIEQEDD